MEEIREKLHQKEAEFEEKYADVINDLATKYNKDLGVGKDMLQAIARAHLYNLEAEYESDIEYDKEEVTKDYAEIELLSKKINGDI